MIRPVVMFTGAQGVGKTTLAEAVEKGMGLKLYPSRAGEVHRKFGVVAGQDVPLALRLEIQQHILDGWLADLAEAEATGGVFDRCPLDFAAYTLAAITRETPQELAAIAQGYVRSCVEVFARTSGHLFLVQPFNALDTGRGSDKAPGGAYADLVQSIIAGLIVNNGIVAKTIGAGAVANRLDLVGVYLADALGVQANQLYMRALLASAGTTENAA